MDKIANARVLTEDGWVENGAVFHEGGVIRHAGPDEGHGLAADRVFDARGELLVPGFIDLHIHGGAGYDFMDASPEAVERICRFHAAHGTTGLLATTMTAPVEKTVEVVSFYRRLGRKTGGAAVLGLHLEGPFINRKYKGAQNGEWIEPATLDNVCRVVEAAGPGWVKLITLAPELVADDRVFSYLAGQGIAVAAGHTGLDYEGGCRCLKRGVRHVTHLGNAMRGFHHREPGLIGLVMEQPDMTFDLIADGIHVAPAFIRLLVRICALDQIMLITDAMRACGLSDGVYELGGQEVRVSGKEARLADGSLAGSLLTLDEALANVIRFTGLPLEAAVRLLTLHPARKLGLDGRKGSIRAGKDADLVLLSRDLQVLATWVEGEQVFRRAGDAGTSAET